VLALAGQPHLDKLALVGACTRLPLRIDAQRLALEVAALPAPLWSSSDGRVGPHRATDALFLRGHAPAEGGLPIEDRPALALLPYAAEIIGTLISATPMRCLLARLPPNARIAPHIDRAPYFSQTIRLHIAVTTHENAYMFCAGSCYLMRPGEVWALNNTAMHGVLNDDSTLARTHLICDFLLSPPLQALLARGERDLGQSRPDLEAKLGPPQAQRSVA
jgi:hypothetical protein